MIRVRSFLKLSVLTLMSLFMIWCLPTSVSAAEVEDNVSFEDVNIQVLSYDETNNRSLAVITASNSANGHVSGDGVRLRATPSTSGRVLELMYDGEYVWIDWSSYGDGGFSWYRIQRIKTGTYGWVSTQYISHWD